MEAPLDKEGRLGCLCDNHPTFQDSDEEQDLVEVSEKTARFLHEKCTSSMPNEVRLKARRRYPLPKVSATKTPQLDSFLRSEVSTNMTT